MARIVISEHMHEGAVARLRVSHDVHYDPGLVDDALNLHKLASGCDALVVGSRTQVRDPLLQVMGRCRVLGLLSVAEDNIDMDACLRRRMEIVGEAGSTASSTAEYVLAAAIMLLRGAFGLFMSETSERAGTAGPREAAGKTIGIIGMGVAGRAVAWLSQQIGMKVVAFDPAMEPLAPAFPVSGVRFADLDALVAHSDVVTLHLAGRRAAQPMLDAARVARMKPGAVLVSTCRPEAVDLRAVAAALRSGALSGAALDVNPGNTPTDSALANCPNLLLTPNVSQSTVEAVERVSMVVAQRLQKLLH
jgi:(S)-sulfolactate dehydrogenase